jgi:hypothetical protein
MFESILAQAPPEFLPNLGAAMVFSLTVAVGLVAALRTRRPVAAVVLGLAGVAIVLLANTDWRLFSNHGMLHASIVYEIFERGAPPEMPLVAGERLQYFYIFHAIVANAMEVVPLGPPAYFSLLSLFCLIATSLAVDRLARLISDDPVYRATAIALAIFGVTTFISGPAGLAIEAFTGLPSESRLDWFHKYAKTNNNQLGILLFCLGYLGCASLVMQRKPKMSLVCVGAAYLATGLLYPPALIGFAAVTTATAFQLWWLEQPSRRTEAALLIAILAVGGVALLPWLRSLTENRTGAGEFQLISVASIPGNLYILAGLFLVPGAIYFLSRRFAPASLDIAPQLGRFLAVSLASIAVAFVLSVGSHSAHLEHKILNLAHLPIAVIAGVYLSSLTKQRTVISIAILSMLVLPVGFKFGPVAAFGWPVVDEARMHGRFYRHTDALQDELYQWISSQTPKDAVLIDSYLAMPVFARRPLFVGVDHRREQGGLQGRFDGWGQRASRMIGTVNGIDQAIVSKRVAAVDQLLLPGNGPLPDEVFRTIREQVSGRPVYVVARNGEIANRLAESRGRFTAAFSNAAATVFVMHL